MRSLWLRALALARVNVPVRRFFPSRSKLVNFNCEYLSLYFTASRRSSGDPHLHLKSRTKLTVDSTETSKGSSIPPSRILPGKRLKVAAPVKKNQVLFLFSSRSLTRSRSAAIKWQGNNVTVESTASLVRDFR